jgi:hypothetical protein
MYLQRGRIPCSRLWGTLGEISQVRKDARKIIESSPQQQQPQVFIPPPSYQEAMHTKEAAAYLVQPHEADMQKIPLIQDDLYQQAPAIPPPTYQEAMRTKEHEADMQKTPLIQGGLYQQASAMLYMTPEEVQQLVTANKQAPANDDPVAVNADTAEAIFAAPVAAPSSSVVTTATPMKDLIDFSAQLPAPQPVSEVKATSTPSQQGLFAAPASAAPRLQQTSLLDLLDQIEVPTHIPQPIAAASAQVQPENTKRLAHA